MRPRHLLPGLLFLVCSTIVQAQLRPVELSEPAPTSEWKEEKRISDWWGERWISPDAYMRAWEEMQRMPAESRREEKDGRRLSAVTQWQPIGPTRVQKRDPNDPNGTHGRIRTLHWVLDGGWQLYAGASSGGVWRRVPGSGIGIPNNWQSLGENLPNPSVGAISVRRRLDGRRAIYVGTGDWILFGGAGLFRTLNDGADWQSVPLLHGTDTVRPGAITAIHSRGLTPSNFNELTDTMYLASDQGFFRSSNLGFAWQLRPIVPSMPRAPIYNLVVDPSNYRTLYATLPSAFFNPRIPGFGIYKSVDAGETWAPVNTGLPAPRLVGFTMALAIAPNSPSTLYTAIPDTTSRMLGIYRTTNGGASWTPTTAPVDYMGGQAFHVNVIAVHPTDPQRVYAGSIGTVRSTDGGGNWSGINTGHADMSAITFVPDALQYQFLASDGGVYLRDDQNDRTVNLLEFFVPSAPLQVDAMDVAQSAPSYIVGGLQDNGTIVTNGSLSSTTRGTWTETYGGDGGRMVDIDPTNERRSYFNEWSGPSPRKRSHDAGFTHENIDHGLAQVSSYTPIMLEKRSGWLFTTDTTHLYYSTDRGDSWRRATTAARDFPASEGAAGMIDVVRDDAGRYLCYATHRGNGTVLRVFEGVPPAMTSRTTFIGSVAPPPGFGRIMIDRWNPEIVYAGTWNFTAPLMVSTDRGLSWQNLRGAVPDSMLPQVRVSSVATLPNRPNTLFAGTDLGVFRSLNGGVTWSRYSYGLPIVPVMEMVYTQLPWEGTREYLRIATYGRGWYQRDISGDEPVWRTSDSAMRPGLRTRCPDSLITCRLYHALIALRGLIDPPLFIPPGCFLVGGQKGEIIRSLDGGLTWDILPTGALGTVTGLVPIGDMSAIAVTSLGEILRTNDLGAAWENLPTPLSAPLRDVRFLDDKNGWAVGDSATLLKTTNGGSSWETVHLTLPFNIPPDLLSITLLPGGMRGWISGVDRSVKPEAPVYLSTTDGGVEWEQQQLPAQGALSQFTFADSATGYAVGEFGTVIKTTDGGTNWFTLGSGTSQNLHAVTFLDTKHGWVAGDSGVILRTEDGGGTWVREESESADRITALAAVGGRAVALGDTSLSQRIRPIDLIPIDPPKERQLPDVVAAVDRAQLQGMRLLSIGPNPFRDRLLVTMSVTEPVECEITITTMRGETVTHLVQRLEPGMRAVEWNGRNDAGEILAGGAYMLRMRVGDRIVSQSIVLQR